MDKKNITIAVLAGLVLIGSLWGSVGNRNAKVLRQELAELKAQLASVEDVSSQSHDAVLTKTAEVQKILQVKEEQLNKALAELVELRKANKSLEAKLSTPENGRMAELQEKMQGLLAKMAEFENTLKAKDELIARIKADAANRIAELEAKIASLQAELEQARAGKSGEAAAATSVNDEAAATIKDLQEQLAGKQQQIETLRKALKNQEQVGSEQTQEPTVVVVQPDESEDASPVDEKELNKAQAQIFGLEKIVEEKNAAVEELSRELDRVKINMDVLLSKIADQQDALQEVQEENSELVKKLAGKSEECDQDEEEPAKENAQ
jgi:chromosome segregation ATPase